MRWYIVAINWKRIEINNTEILLRQYKIKAKSNMEALGLAINENWKRGGYDVSSYAVMQLNQ